MAGRLFDIQRGTKLMSKRNNVNPGQYKVAGRERMGESLGQNADKQAYVKNREAQESKRKPTKKR